MKAIVVEGPDGPDALRLGEVPEPQPGPGEVLLAVATAGVNRADLLQSRGLYPPPPGASQILGLEAAGTVLAAGEGVEGWAPGDRAMALLAGGGYAERVAVPAGQLMAVPDGMAPAEAAAIPEAFVTAWLSLRRLTGLSAGETLLVHAAAGGVGSAALQIGRELGASAIGTVRNPAKAGRLAEWGAEAVVVGEDGFADRVRELSGGAGADVILDMVGASYWEENLRCLATGGRISVVGLLGGARVDLDLSALMRLRASVGGTTLRARPVAEKASLIGELGAWALARLADGRLRAVVDRVLPLERAGEAHRLMEQDAPVGKLVLSLSENWPPRDALPSRPDRPSQETGM